jgi:hypothetical protein
MGRVDVSQLPSKNKQHNQAADPKKGVNNSPENGDTSHSAKNDGKWNNHQQARMP